MGYISERDAGRVIEVNTRLGFAPFRERLSVFLDRALLDRALTEFREHLGGRLHIALLERLGQKIDVHEIDLVRMQEAVKIVTSQSPSALGRAA
jgi:3-dehydroquinate synthase